MQINFAPVWKARSGGEFMHIYESAKKHTISANLRAFFMRTVVMMQATKTISSIWYDFFYLSLVNAPARAHVGALVEECELFCESGLIVTISTSGALMSTGVAAGAGGVPGAAGAGGVATAAAAAAAGAGLQGAELLGAQPSVKRRYKKGVEESAGASGAASGAATVATVAAAAAAATSAATSAAAEWDFEQELQSLLTEDLRPKPAANKP